MFFRIFIRYFIQVISASIFGKKGVGSSLFVVFSVGILLIFFIRIFLLFLIFLSLLRRIGLVLFLYVCILLHIRVSNGICVFLLLCRILCILRAVCGVFFITAAGFFLNIQRCQRILCWCWLLWFLCIVCCDVLLLRFHRSCSLHGFFSRCGGCLGALYDSAFLFRSRCHIFFRLRAFFQLCFSTIHRFFRGRQLFCRLWFFRCRFWLLCGLWLFRR